MINNKHAARCLLKRQNCYANMMRLMRADGGGSITKLSLHGKHRHKIIYWAHATDRWHWKAMDIIAHSVWKGEHVDGITKAPVRSR